MSGRASFDEQVSRSREIAASLPAKAVVGKSAGRPADPDGDGSERPKEITLGASGILIVVMVLLLLCGGFFLYGYTVGHNSAEVAGGTSSGSLDPGFGSFKPPPGSPKMQAIAGYDANGNPIGTDPATSAANSEAALARNTSASKTATVVKKDPEAVEAETVAAAAEPAVATPTRAPQHVSLGPNALTATGITAPVARVPVALSAGQGAAPAGPAIVQVAAVSHPEDADLLLSALGKRGYNAVSATSPADKLIHVQLGPFSNRQDAVAMQKRLLADGFNAIIR